MDGLAGTLDVYERLGDRPPRFALQGDDRHGFEVPLQRDPGIATVEGRIHGDFPWPAPRNMAYRWIGPDTMSRLAGTYLRDNWDTVRADLALDGEHLGRIVSGDVVGQGYYNLGMSGAGPRLSTYSVTTLARVRVRLPFVVTIFPSGT